MDPVCIGTFFRAVVEVIKGVICCSIRASVSDRDTPDHGRMGESSSPQSCAQKQRDGDESSIHACPETQGLAFVRSERKSEFWPRLAQVSSDPVNDDHSRATALESFECSYRVVPQEGFWVSECAQGNLSTREHSARSPWGVMNTP